MKEVLSLNRIYAANPNAVGMQVYASAFVYTALRVAQAEVAHEAGIEPEEISPAKFFPKMAAACHDYVVAEYAVEEMIRLNPGKDLVRPSTAGRKFTTVELESIRVRKRNEVPPKAALLQSTRPLHVDHEGSRWPLFILGAGGRRGAQLFPPAAHGTRGLRTRPAEGD